MSRKNSSVGSCIRGARTHACRVHTRVNARTPARICTGPRIILRPSNQPCLYRISLNILSNPVPLRLISNPMIVGLALPKLLAGPVEHPIGFPRRGSFERLQQDTWRNDRQQKQVNVIRHDHERPKAILPQCFAAKKRIDYENSDCFFPQMDRTRMRTVEVAIHPRESFSIGHLAGRREVGARQAAVQMPGEEEPAIVRINVGKAALGRHSRNSAGIEDKISRSHECERGTHECVRHRTSVEHSLSSVEHSLSSVEHSISSVEHSISSVEHSISSVEHAAHF